MKNEVEQTPAIEPEVEEKSLVLPIVITALVTAVVFSGIFALIFVFGFNSSDTVEEVSSVKTYQSVAKSNCQKTGGNFDMDSGCNCGEATLEEDTGFCVFDDGSFGGEFGELQKAFLESKMEDVEKEDDVSGNEDDVASGGDQALRIVSNENGGYSFEIPLDWGVIMPEGKSRGMTTNFDPQKEPKLWAGGLSVYGTPEGSYKQFMDELYGVLTLKNQSDVTVAGLKGISVEYEYEMNGVHQGWIVLVISGQNLYEIKLEKKENTSKDIFDNIIKSFKITGTPVMQ